MKAIIAKGRKFLLVMSVCATSSALTCFITAQPGIAETTAAGGSADEQTIRRQAEDFSKAFAVADAYAIANMWTDDCSFTDVNGQHYVGRAAIRKLYEQFFRESGPQTSTVKIESINFPSTDICLEEGVTTLGKANSTNRYTVVHVKRNGDWKMLSVVESRCDNAPTESLKELNWLVGDWVAKTADRTIHLKVQLISNGNFLAARYLNVNGVKETPQELQITGLDAKSGHLISWHFGGNGGYGFGRWTRDNSTWRNQTTGVTTDGIATRAIYSYIQTDNDHFSWSSTERTIAGRKLPDREPVQVTRTKSEGTSPGVIE